MDKKLLAEKAEREIGPNWVRPHFQNERGEVERVVEEFLALEPNEENVKEVFNVLESAPLVELSDEEWGSLENTDSFHNIRPGHIEDVEKITGEYNQELLPENRRDLKKILDGFIGGNEMESPTILRNKKGELHLVSGNTRLMISRALGIRPKVIIGELN